MTEPRWSHTSNAIGHPARPSDDRWHDERYGQESSVCVECGFYVWLTPDWAKYRN